MTGPEVEAGAERGGSWTCVRGDELGATTARFDGGALDALLRVVGAGADGGDAIDGAALQSGTDDGEDAFVDDTDAGASAGGDAGEDELWARGGGPEAAGSASI